MTTVAIGASLYVVREIGPGDTVDVTGEEFQLEDFHLPSIPTSKLFVSSNLVLERLFLEQICLLGSTNLWAIPRDQFVAMLVTSLTSLAAALVHDEESYLPGSRLASVPLRS
jgi:hypothetical protein